MVFAPVDTGTKKFIPGSSGAGVVLQPLQRDEAVVGDFAERGVWWKLIFFMALIPLLNVLFYSRVGANMILKISLKNIEHNLPVLHSISAIFANAIAQTFMGHFKYVNMF
jgi:hypothetical protein